MNNHKKLTGYYSGIWILLLIVMLCSCGIFWPRKHEPKAKFCYLDLNSKVLYCNPPNGGGISKINVFLHSDNYTYFILKNEVYNSSQNKIELSDELSKIDQSLFKQHELHIEIWNNSPVIFDYGIDVLPENWGNKKIVYGCWNVR